MVRYKSNKPSKESQPRGKNYEKNQKKKSKKKATKSGLPKTKEKKEEKKIESKVEKKMESKEKKKPKAGNVGYMGVFDGTKQRSKRKNNPITVYDSPDTAITTYEGDWQGETCKTDSSGQNIFSGTADIIAINPKSLGASIENEARNWRYYEIEEMELWIEPLQGVVNTPGNICFAIETDPSYFSTSGATLDFDTVNSYRPHVDHPVYVQDKPIRLVYKRSAQKTASSNQYFYTYFDPTQFATNSSNAAATGIVDSNVRQCFQFALIAYNKACTASTELGVWQMRVKINWRGNKKSQALPGFLEAEKYADSIINQNSKDYTEQLAEYKRRTDAGEFLQKPQHFPNPRQVDTYRIMALGYQRNYNATKNLLVLRKYQQQRDEVALYDRIKGILSQNSLKLNQMLVPSPLQPGITSNPVSAMPVVIVDPSLSTDPRLAANSQAAKVGTDGTLQTTGSSGLVNVNISQIGGSSTSPGVLPVNAQLVNGSNQPLTTFSDGLGNRMLASLSHGLFVDDVGASTTTLRPIDMQRGLNFDGKGINYTGYGQVPYISIDGDNHHGVPVGLAEPNNVGLPLAIKTAGTLNAYNNLALANGTNPSVSVPVCGSNSTSTTQYPVKNAQWTPSGDNPIAVLADSSSQYVTMSVPAIQFTTNAGLGHVQFVPQEAVSVPYTDSSSNAYTGYNVPRIGMTAGALNNGGQFTLVDSAGNTAVNLTRVNGTSVTSGTGGSLPVIVKNAAGTQTANVSTSGSLQTVVSATISSDDKADVIEKKKEPRSQSVGAKPRDTGYEVVQFGYRCPKCKAQTIGNAFDQLKCKQCNVDCVRVTITTNAVLTDGSGLLGASNVAAAPQS